MFIAIVSYRPIYNAIYQTVDCSTKSEMTGKTTVEVNAALLPGTPDSLITTRTHKEFSDGTIMDITAKTIRYQDVSKKTLIDEKKSIQLNTNNYWILVMLVFIQIVFVTMVYGPIAAFLVEMFPAKIRYTSMSLPYHIGNGIFGGLLPTVATYLVSTAKTSGNAEWYLQGLWYPIVVGAVCLAIGLLYLNKNDNKIKE